VEKGWSVGSVTVRKDKTLCVLLHSRVARDNGNVLYTSKARQKDFECFNRKEIIDDIDI
jgi:hypothetical protein